jgi:hypothetical protein
VWENYRDRDKEGEKYGGKDTPGTPQQSMMKQIVGKTEEI